MRTAGTGVTRCPSPVAPCDREGSEMAVEWKPVADVLRRQGWRKGSYGTMDGPVCVLGACAIAWHGDVEWFDAMHRKPETYADDLPVLNDLLGHLGIRGYDDISEAGRRIANYNDDEATTVWEILELVDGLAAEDGSDGHE